MSIFLETSRGSGSKMAEFLLRDLSIVAILGYLLL